ncbi:MAG: glycosyltransferase family 2 protein [Treponema sp.]|nr:glycosyltransferase family 2 protein [Treponema sp.]
MQPKISVCIPVFNSELTLLRCLESVYAQNFTDWEILVVNDGSSGKDLNNKNCKKIVKQFRKSHKLSKKQVFYLEHRSNLGLLEARRTLVESAHGKYIAMLDSDDSLLPEALSALYDSALKTGADIVQGGAEVFFDEEQTENSSENSEVLQKRIQKIKEKTDLVYEGELCGKEIFDAYLVNKKMNGFLWGKLILRETYLEALSYIPFTHCVFAEDFLQYFFISYCAKKYAGIKTPVYRYSIDSGISSSKKITDIATWEQVCSTATVFVIIFAVIKEFPPETFSSEQLEAIRFLSRSYLANNLQQLKDTVVSELQNDAMSLLCEYWGEDFVKTMQSADA